MDTRRFFDQERVLHCPHETLRGANLIPWWLYGVCGNICGVNFVGFVKKIVSITNTSLITYFQDTPVHTEYLEDLHSFLHKDDPL